MPFIYAWYYIMILADVTGVARVYIAFVGILIPPFLYPWYLIMILADVPGVSQVYKAFV